MWSLLMYSAWMVYRIYCCIDWMMESPECRTCKFVAAKQQCNLPISNNNVYNIISRLAATDAHVLWDYVDASVSILHFEQYVTYFQCLIIDSYIQETITTVQLKLHENYTEISCKKYQHFHYFRGFCKISMKCCQFYLA